MSKIANDNPLQEGGELTQQDNIILPFQLESSGLRGRVVRIGSVLNDILRAHSYPKAVEHLLAETTLLSLLLSSMLKYEGVFTLQTSGEGAVKTLLGDVTTDGMLRAYSAFNEEALKKLETAAGEGRYAGSSLNDLTGTGYLAFTVDQGAHTDRYQGIVALEGETLAQSVRHYFDQSEQIGTVIKAHARQDENGDWHGGALILQRLAEDERFDLENAVTSIAQTGREQRDEDWNRSVILAESVTEAELVDSQILPQELLIRLFHEEGIRVFNPTYVWKGCRCSEDRVRAVLSELSEDDRAYSEEDGKISVTCEFCSTEYSFDYQEFERCQ